MAGASSAQEKAQAQVMSGQSGHDNEADEFEGCAPKRVDAVKVFDLEHNLQVWTHLYNCAGMASGSEKDKRGLRCAVYEYCCVNGTSPQGEYTGVVVTNSGKRFEASNIPVKVGRKDIRRFLRANSAETIRYFKKEKPWERNNYIRAKCEEKGIRYEEAITLCDWLDFSTGLTPVNRDTSHMLKNYGVQRAGYARGGANMEDLRERSLAMDVEAQQINVPPVVKSAGKGW